MSPNDNAAWASSGRSRSGTLPHPIARSPPRGDALRVKRPDTVGQPPSKVLVVPFSGKFPELFCLQRRHVGHTNFGTWGWPTVSGRFRDSQLSITAHYQHSLSRAKL